jgi:hypothetical protein
MTQLLTALVCRLKDDHKPRNELIILIIYQIEKILLPSFSPFFRKNAVWRVSEVSRASQYILMIRAEQNIDEDQYGSLLE